MSRRSRESPPERRRADGTRRSAGHVAPWAFSVMLHAGLLAIGLVVTWTVVRSPDEREPVLVTAEFDAPAADPLVALESEPLAAPGEAAAPALAPALPETVAGGLDEPAALPEPADVPAGTPAFAQATGGGEVRFAGLRAGNARRIVWVIDASGSMIAALPVVLRELARSLERLAPEQHFGIVFFQRGVSVTVPPVNRLQPATDEARRRALAWIDANVAPAGRSDPLAALEKALQLEPDVVFLLSEDITGSGRFEIDQADLLRLLDRLNPAEGRTGRRAARINCVQFPHPDPLETMRRIAEAHGGPDGYRLLNDRAR